MNHIFHKLSYNLQEKILPKIFVYQQIYKTNLLKQLNSYIKYGAYNILFNNYTIRPIKKNNPHSKAFYKYFFTLNTPQTKKKTTTL